MEPLEVYNWSLWRCIIGAFGGVYLKPLEVYTIGACGAVELEPLEMYSWKNPLVQK